MGNDKEDSGFGFKDRAKAEETLKLLEQHDANYRRLTVRGLLGRAKRVLSMTKAEEKIKNIKEAMEVFENWLAELESNKQKPEKKERKEEKKEKNEEKRRSSDKESASDEGKEALPSESVSGLGFKDAAAAEDSLRVLEGRDPDYQLLAVKGLLGRAKRVLTCTKDETKLSNIKEAMAILEGFVDEFDNKHMSRQNCPYLSEGLVRTANNLAGDAATDQHKGFLAAYTSVNGEYKRLRNVAVGDSTWDIVRNAALKEIKEEHAHAKLFNEKDEPTKEHLQFLLWAYSPEASKVKKVIKETKEDVPAIASLEIDKDKKREDRKRRSSANDEAQSKKIKE